MSYMTSFETAEEFYGFMRAEITNLADMTKSAYPDAPSLSTGDLTGNDVTASQCSYSIDDSCHFSPFSGDRIDPTSNADPGTAHQSTSRPHGQRHHTLTHGMGLHHEYLPQETNSSIYFLPTQLSMRAGENGANGQTVKISSQSRQRRLSNSEDGTQADSTQGQPPKKRQRRSHARGNTAKNSAATGEAQENSEAAKRNQESGGLRRGSDYRGPRIRWTDGVMEWLDDGDFQWKQAGYHSNYRAELIALAAQQPEAPGKLFKPQFPATELMKEAWTEDMGTSYTSYSPLTRGWTDDPTSVVDSKGRQVFSMKKPPEGWIQNPKYGLLIYNGLVMLDHDDLPVRDIPGLPLTLETHASAWLLEGLRRCTKITIPDLKARFPAATKETPTSIKSTTITQRIGRWLAKKEITQWLDRPNAKVKQHPAAAAEIDHQGSETVGREHLPHVGQALGLDDLNSGLSKGEMYFSVDVSNKQAFKHGSTQSRAGVYLFDNEDPHLPSWHTSALAGLGGHADTCHLPISESYNSISSLQRTPAYSGNRFGSEKHGKRKLCGDSGFYDDYPVRRPSNRTGMLVPWTESKNTDEANHDSSVLNLSNLYGQPSTAAPVPRGGTEFLDRSSTNVDTQNSLFDGGDFRYITPKTAAEIAFVKSALDYTRAEYKTWMSVEPPENSYLVSYAEQYCEMQAHLEKTWPFSSSPPIKLRAIGPVFGGLDQW